MDTNKHSEIDKLFRSKISDQNNSEWNTPPKQVLFDALDQIEEKESSKKGFFLFAGIIGFLVLGILGIGFLNNNKINQLDNKIESALIKKDVLNPVDQNQNNTIQANELKTNEPNISNLEKNIVSNVIPEKRAVNKTKISKSTNLKAPLSNTKTNGIGFDNTPIKNIKKNDGFPHYKMPVMFTDKNKSSKQNLIPSISKPISIKPITLLEKGHLNNLNIDNRTLDVLDLNILIANKPHTIAKKTASLFLIAGANFSTFSMSALNPLSANLKSYDNYYMGQQIGFGGYLPFSKKLSFKPRFTYNKIRNKSNHIAQLVYDKNLESINTDGSYAYNSTLDMESPLGVYSRSISMDHGDEISHGSILTNETQILNSFNILQFTGALDYTLMESSKISWSIFGGLGLNFVAGMNQNMSHHTYYNNDLIHNDEFDVSELNALNKVYYSAQLGSSIRYNLTNQTFIGLEAEYLPSLGSVRRVDPNTQIKTKVNQINGSLMFGFKF